MAASACTDLIHGSLGLHRRDGVVDEREDLDGHLPAITLPPQHQAHGATTQVRGGVVSDDTHFWLATAATTTGAAVTSTTTVAAATTTTDAAVTSTTVPAVTFTTVATVTSAVATGTAGP